MIFDAHMHVGDFGPMFNVAIDRDGLAQQMAEHGITGGLVFSPDNELAGEVAASIDGMHALVWVNPRLPGYVEEAARFLADARFVGLKMHPLLDGYHPNDPSVHPLMELAAEHDVPVLVHSGHPIFTLPWSIEELAAAFPHVKVVMAHMGHGNVVYINAAIDIAERRPNVYLETSGMPMHTKIRDAVARVGADRVLFGTDTPFHHPTVEIAKVRVSGLAPDLVDRVLGASARALFLKEDPVHA